MAGSRLDPARCIKQPHSLSPRVQRLRDFYFQGVERPWRNEWCAFTTGTAWDSIYNELSFHIVPETYPFLQVFGTSLRQAARPVPLHPDFWRWSLPERRAWFLRQVMLEHLPAELLPGDLLAGGRFNVQCSGCWTRSEARARERGVKRARAEVMRFHRHGYGNAGATSGHLIPDYRRVLQEGFQGIHQELVELHDALPPAEQAGAPGAQLRAMRTAACLARDLATRYAGVCRAAAEAKADSARRAELAQMAANLERVPWRPAESFWEALQSLWLAHMLVMADEGYPGPGVSFGRFDQLLGPYWERSLAQGMPRELGKELLGCFWIHANTAYDAMLRVGGNQGITSGFGQLVTLGGLGPGGRDLTNDLTWAVLEVIDELSPILEPKPNVRLHQRSPEALLDRLVDMIARSQGAPFLLNFDERSMAGLLRQARLAGVEDRIHPGNVHDYAPVGCLENTMQGNDRSGTVDCNLNLLKAVELALAGGRDLVPAVDALTGKADPVRQDGPATGDPDRMPDFEAFYAAFTRQMRAMIARCVALYELSESIRAETAPTPYLSCLVRGCARQARDVTQGGAELSFVTLEGVTFATCVDSLLAIRELVFEQKRCSTGELVRALRDNWSGHERLQAWARFRAPKYGRDEDAADALALRVMRTWTDEVWRHRTRATGRQFRPGMLSWNYWVGDGYVMAASADGRPQGQFLSNAICPTNGADLKGPTACANSVGKALGGAAPDGLGGDFAGLFNLLPNGASHTLTFHPALVRDPAHREKLKAFLKGYARNGGTALQLNVLDAEVLREAQRRPGDFRHLLVRVTGYNAYFTAIGKELQDEVIARESHRAP
ncbi:MAG TPA: pyruvate formate lyase family protein [Myxococcota bacterium]|nr:pyruvate formate lyase family protein [Myxococcota bacterium]HRY96221.1 pyruvate formate lyase family protein [Myxococcota bacterium]HSA22170.1 pyruvate formate lyase family protein [Myxococcota bacterium]